MKALNYRCMVYYLHIFHSLSVGRPSLHTLMQELHILAADWKSLMLALGLEPHQLDEIDCDHPKVRAKLTSALSKWLSRKRDASWIEVVYALRQIEENKLASHIEATYCQSKQQPQSMGRFIYLL